MWDRGQEIESRGRNGRRDPRSSTLSKFMEARRREWLLCAFDVTAFSRVHANLLALLDEGGDLNGDAGFELRRLAYVADRGALDLRLGLDDDQRDDLRNFDADRRAFVKVHIDQRLRQQIAHRVPEVLGAQ